MKTSQTGFFTSLWLVLICFLLGRPVPGHAGGLVAVWGDNFDGQTRLPLGVNSVTAIAGGRSHCLALKADRSVMAWGPNTYGVTNVPPGLSNVMAIAAGGYHNLALRTDGTLVTWGDSSFGQSSVPPGLSNVVAISAGEAHCLALQANGRVVAWGNYVSGQTSVPPGLSNVVAIAAGGYHSLALTADGRVVAWGADLSGQSSVPPGLSNVVAIAAGILHSLALKADGRVVGWGYNYYGQADAPPGLSNAVAIAAGESHSLALTGDGRVVAWGDNYQGQTNVPPGLSNVTAIAVGRAHNLALVSEGPIQILSLESIEVPYRSNATFSVVATGREPLSYQWYRFNPYYLNWTAISAGTNATLTLSNAQFSDIGTYAVGVSNAFGSVFSTGASLTVISAPFFLTQLASSVETVGANVTLWGYASGTPALSYQWQFNGTNLSGATNSWLTLGNVQISSSGSYSVLVTNLYGSTLSAEAVLTVVDGPPHIQRQPNNQVAGLSGAATLVVSATGTQPLSYQWRFNAADIPGATNAVLNLQSLRYEQTGYYHAVVRNSFGEVVSSKAWLSVVPALVWSSSYNVPTNLPPGLSNLVAVSAGDYHVLALKGDGSLAVWGRSAESVPYGQTAVTNVPPGLNPVAAIASGPKYNLALKADGTVTAWGYQPPAVPSGLSNVLAIAAGDWHALALKSNGTVLSWGANGSGQTNVPPGLSNVVAVAAGASHSLALKADGTVVAWGRSAYDQTNVPSSASNVIAITAAGERSMALRQDGTVVVWGLYSPTPPPGLSNVVAIASGRNRLLALRSDGTLVSWGSGAAAMPAGLTNVIAMAASVGYGDFSVAVVGDGTPALTIHPASQTTALEATVQFHTRAVGVPPLSYQWQWEGQDLPGATDAELTLTNVQRGNLGAYRVVVSNALGYAVSATATLTIPYPGTLAASLNATNLVWTNAVMSVSWSSQVRESHDGDAAAQSGRITDNQRSVLQTTVSGPGKLTFWWKVSSEPNFDFLQFFLDGAASPLVSISGETDWQQRTVSISPGTHLLQWIYVKDAGLASGQDAGWLDQVTFTPQPLILQQPADQTAWMGASVTFQVLGRWGDTASLQWLKNSTNLPGAHSNFLTLTDLTRYDSGTYALQISNAAGTVISHSARLRVLVPQQLAVPRLLADGTFVFSSGDADGGLLQPEDATAFELQVSSNLVDWTTLTDALVVTNGSLLFRDSTRTNHPVRFYRAVEH